MNVFEKIEKQQTQLNKDSAAWVVGEQLKEICTDPQCAELVSTDLDNAEMGLVMCEKEIKRYADKHRNCNFAYVSPMIAEGIIRKFYGLPERGTAAKTQQDIISTQQNVISLDDYL